jgi:AraC-like DNA-binding protein
VCLSVIGSREQRKVKHVARHAVPSHAACLGHLHNLSEHLLHVQRRRAGHTHPDVVVANVRKTMNDPRLNLDDVAGGRGDVPQADAKAHRTLEHFEALGLDRVYVRDRDGTPGPQSQVEAEPLAVSGGSGLDEGKALARDRVVHHLHMSGAFYCHSELTEPWGMTLPELPGHVWFHAVAEGAVQLGDRRLVRGDVALVTHGDGHVLCSQLGVAAPDILALEREHVSELYETLRHGGGGAPTRLLCGAIRFEHPAARNLIATLPDVIALDSAPLQATLAMLAAETREAQPGGEAIITRLADVIVIQAIRGWIVTDPAAQTGWLGALRDPHLGRALTLIHRDPARAWTVAALASELAMSRSAFAARFSKLVGVPAMEYVTDWRMQLARNRLRDGATVAQVAGELGYRSEAAFARAFKRVTGTPPGAARRETDLALA